ncbi:MAG: thioether cross-link-forming SCIFF peptide maturase [Oscillospiraceae bacterium]|nr:thioether cross-link-forming SCIFF peptide maturase [Oscillospiraceae bacterium]
MVHTFENLGCYIAVDVNSGAVHVLDKMMFDLLRRIENLPRMPERCPDEVKSELGEYAPEELDECWAELLELQENGLLFERDDYVNPAMALVKNAPVKALCLNVSHDCNLRCKYCFASTGDFGLGRKTMSVETAKRAIDFVIQRSGIRRNIEVDFFGGEPLMAMDTVKETVKYARSIEEEKGKRFRFTITTNGVLLNEENIAYINETMDNCVLSLDGRACVNDAHRPTANGKGSYDLIVPKFQKLVEKRGDKDFYLRGTFTRDNLDFAEDVLHIASLGFERGVSVEPAVGKPDDPFAITEDEVETVKAEYDTLARALVDHPEINFFHFNVDLEQGPCVIKRMRGCGAGSEYVCITPDGDIYPCHQFVGNEAFKLGNLYDESFDLELSAKFAGMNIYTRKECGSCWAKFYCSGGCSAANYNVNGDITQPSHVGCEMERKRLECAIAIKAIRAGLAE